MTVRALDRAGNATSSNPRAMTVDGTPPTSVALTTPGAVNQARPRLTWNAASDATTGVSGYDVSIDGGATTRVSGTEHTPPSALREGRHTYSVRAVDGFGNASPAVTGTLLVDTTVPSEPSALGPRATRDTTPQLTWRASTDGEDGSGVVRYEVSLGGLDPIPVPAGTDALDFGQVLEEGDYVWTVQAIDNAGNASRVARRTISIDRDRPALSTRLRALGLGRLRLRCASDETVRCAIRVFASRSVSARLGLGRREATLTRRTTKAARRRTVSLRLSSRARRGLLRTGAVPVRVRVRAVDLAGNRSSTRTRRVTVR
jgi:hypothetical protein